MDLPGPDGEGGGLQRDDRAVRLGDAGRVEQQVRGSEGHRSSSRFTGSAVARLDVEDEAGCREFAPGDLAGVSTGDAGGAGVPRMMR
jgi:hypothetical protein